VIRSRQLDAIEEDFRRELRLLRWAYWDIRKRAMYRYEFGELLKPILHSIVRLEAILVALQFSDTDADTGDTHPL
jgi:hypothetical protein